MQNNGQKLFSEDPQKAMAQVMEKYAGLVWRTAQQYLENPEDIKECVNDTFMEFYMHRERFGPAKGTLGTFLVAIARNRAIGLYRKNKAHESLELEDLASDTDEAENLNLKMDLEKAMSVLAPEDREIIRMKYFVGMTIQEIADSLKLPYETVKKRHQRSLGKMRIALVAALTLLLALLLAACTHMAVRYLGIVPGFGLTENLHAPIHMLEEGLGAAIGAGE